MCFSSNTFAISTGAIRFAEGKRPRRRLVVYTQILSTLYTIQRVSDMKHERDPFYVVFYGFRPTLCIRLDACEK